MEDRIVEILKALSDPTRLSIVKRLAKCSNLCACNLQDEYAITQPTLSFHMKKLTKCGLVNARKEGVWIKYTLNQEALGFMKKELDI